MQLYTALISFIVAIVARPLRLLIALGLTLASVQSANADWPHLRGPNYDGVSSETGIADTWPRGGPPRLWTRELGQGHSGFIVAEGRVYTQRQTLAGQYLLCLDPDNGQTNWQTRYDWAWQPKGAYPGPYATPTWYRGKIYYASPTGLVGCMDAATGALLWSLNVREKFDGKGYGFGYAATPLLLEGRMIPPVGGPGASLVALDAHDGATIWTAGSDAASYCPALPILFNGRVLIVGYLENALVLVDAATGKLWHRQSLSVGYDEHSAWPIYQEPYLFLASPFRVPAIRLQLNSGLAEALVCQPNWTSRELGNDIVSSVLYEGHLYGFDLKQAQASKHRASRGTFKCLDWGTGKVCWATDQVGQASVLAVDGKLLLLNDSGSLILARADPTEYRELARTQIFEDEICWTPPTLWNGRLFVRSPTQAVCLFVGSRENKPNVSNEAPAITARAWRFNGAWLLSRERDYPNDAFSSEEMTLWYGACLLILGAAALATASIGVVIGRLARRTFFASTTFWCLTFIFGFLSPNVIGSQIDACLFTWPVSLYAAFHATLLTYCWAEQHSSLRRARWVARCAVLGLVLVSYGYFELCKSVGMFIGWYFLFGFLPSFIFSYLASRAEVRKQSPWIIISWTVVAFTAFFWSCQGFLWWQAAH
jgi:hypothetical protein